MNSIKQLALASSLATAVLLSACGSNNNDDLPAAGSGAPPPVGVVPGPVPPGTPPVAGVAPGAVPSGTFASGTSFIDFLAGLANDETSEPLSISEGSVGPTEDSNDARPFG